MDSNFRTEINIILTSEIGEKDFISITLSSPISSNAEFTKIKIVPKKNKNGIFFQFEYFYDSKVKHENTADIAEVIKRLTSILALGYKQTYILFSDRYVQIFIDKKMKISVLRGNLSTTNKIKTEIKDHNNEKNYILKEGVAVNWLVSLGIMNTSGKVLNPMQKKFRQINKFLENIQDIKKQLPMNPTIVDFGCGKSYLSFAMYDYLCKEGYTPTIIGLDLKADVIENCNAIAKENNFTGLTFHVGDVANYFDSNKDVAADMLITLHACDTATDYAIYHALKWRCKVIVVVPCCQHEILGQIKNEDLQPLLKHGIMKERFSSLLTDAIRANIIEAYGYKVSVLEFIDTEHTPKNIMIRATAKNFELNKEKLDDILQMQNMFGASPILCELAKNLD